MSRSAYNYIEVLRILFESDSKTYTLEGRIHQNGMMSNTEILITPREVTKIVTELKSQHEFSTERITTKFDCPEFSFVEMNFTELPFNAIVRGVDFSPETKQIRA